MNNIVFQDGEQKICLYSLLTVTVAIVIGITLLNPLWASYSPPFEIPKVLPAITAPVDGPFYLWNAEYGYRWDTQDPLSLWFHPLMSWLVMIMPAWLPNNIWFWLISISFGVGSLILTYQLAFILIPTDNLSTKLIPLTLLAVGGLGLATGNAEIPTLFFATALLLSILHWQIWWLTLSCAALAILTKPNALYLIPVMAVYFVSGALKRDMALWGHAFLGMVALLLTWIAWMGIVDWSVGQSGVYWHTRELFREYVAGDPWNFFRELAFAFLYGDDVREQVRYCTAIIIPVVNLWIIGLITLSNEYHRYALAAGNLAMLAIALYTGNPNKMIVYTTTLPGYFATHLLFVRVLELKISSPRQPIYFLMGVFYLIYCLVMLVIYVLGTPLGWYY